MHQANDLTGTHAAPTAVVLNFSRGGAEAPAIADDGRAAAMPRASQNETLARTCNLLIMAIVALPFALAVIALLRRLI